MGAGTQGPPDATRPGARLHGPGLPAPRSLSGPPVNPEVTPERSGSSSGVEAPRPRQLNPPASCVPTRERLHPGCSLSDVNPANFHEFRLAEHSVYLGKKLLASVTNIHLKVVRKIWFHIKWTRCSTGRAQLCSSDLNVFDALSRGLHNLSGFPGLLCFSGCDGKGGTHSLHV